MFFESNGIPRVVEVTDLTQQSAAEGGSRPAAKALRDKADPAKIGSVAAPMAGEIIEVKVKPGARRKDRAVTISHTVVMSC